MAKLAAVKAAVSKAERKRLRKATPAKPRKPKGDAEVRVAAPAPTAPEPADRDGLVWLHKHKRLSAAQAQVGLAYRDLFRHVVDMGGAPLGSNLDNLLSGGGQSAGGAAVPGGGTYTASAARQELFRLRWVVLAGQSDLHTVMDGVCGLAHTVRYLAGGNQVRAAQLEAALRIALDLLIADARPKLAKSA